MRGKEVSDIVGKVTNRLRMESFFTALLVLELTLFSTLWQKPLASLNLGLRWHIINRYRAVQKNLLQFILFLEIGDFIVFFVR